MILVLYSLQRDFTILPIQTNKQAKKSFNCKPHVGVVSSTNNTLIILLLLCDFCPFYPLLVCAGSDKGIWMDPMLYVYYMKDRSCTIALTRTGLASSLSQMARSLTLCGRLTQLFSYFWLFPCWSTVWLSGLDLGLPSRCLKCCSVTVNHFILSEAILWCI